MESIAGTQPPQLRPAAQASETWRSVLAPRRTASRIVRSFTALQWQMIKTGLSSATWSMLGQLKMKFKIIFN